MEIENLPVNSPLNTLVVSPQEFYDFQYKKYVTEREINGRDCRFDDKINNLQNQIDKLEHQILKIAALAFTLLTIAFISILINMYLINGILKNLQNK